MLVRIGDAIIDCLEARTPQEHTTGLSKTEALGPGEGMLFIPSIVKNKPQCFWMPGQMRFAIDIVYITDKLQVSKIYANCPPGGGKYPGFAAYVLEVPAGAARELGITVGAKVVLEQEVEHESMQSTDVLRGLTQASAESEHEFHKRNVSETTDSIKRAVARGLLNTFRTAQGNPVMDPSEFVSSGLLQELNRQFLHPIGLALFVAEEEDGTTRLGGIYDYRHDPEGVQFQHDLLDAGKAARVHAMQIAGDKARLKAFGYAIQPIPQSLDSLTGMDRKMKRLEIRRNPSPSPEELAWYDRSAQSTETAPYQRAPSVAPTTSPQERYKSHDTFDNVVTDGGPAVTEGPVHDESWNSPTRAAQAEGFTQAQDDVGRTYDYDAKLEHATEIEIPGLPKESREIRYV